MIRFGDDKSTGAQFYGTIPFGGFEITALYIPNFRFSLLSLCQLDFAGFQACFGQGVCRLIRSRVGSETVMLTARLNDGLYVLDFGAGEGNSHEEDSRPSVLNTQALLVTAECWHRRLGHLNWAYMGFVPGLRGIKESGGGAQSCRVCIEAKQKRVISRAPAERSVRPFELLHSDSCGKMPPSFSGARYYLLFVDDYSRWTFTYFLQTKGSRECVAAFGELLAFLKTHYGGYPVARLRCDNGKGEFDNELLHRLLRENGILFLPSPPRTQHKNGVAERMIQTLNSRARAMMLDGNLPIQFWAEMINTASYLHRISPTSSLGHKSPFEVLHRALVQGSFPLRGVSDDCLPGISHLRRIGCVAYRRIPDVDVANKTELKFGPRARRCMMVGYTDTTKIWRLWDFSGHGGKGRPIHYSDVVFLEDENALVVAPNVSEEAGTSDSLFPDALDTPTAVPGVSVWPMVSRICLARPGRLDMSHTGRLRDGTFS